MALKDGHQLLSWIQCDVGRIHSLSSHNRFNKQQCRPQISDSIFQNFIFHYTVYNGISNAFISMYLLIFGAGPRKSHQCLSLQSCGININVYLYSHWSYQNWKLYIPHIETLYPTFQNTLYPHFKTKQNKNHTTDYSISS